MKNNMMDLKQIPIPVWIAGAVLVALIVLALVGYLTGQWEPPPQ